MPAPKLNKNPKTNNIPAKSAFKLRPIEMFGVALLIFAVFFFAMRGCNSKKTVPTVNLAAISDSSQLQVKASNLRPLYVVIDSLKLRSRPQLDSSFIRYLSYDEMVFDMGEQTQYTQTIRYSVDEIRTEPWIKVRTKENEIGWVFGAGINFYRKKRRVLSTILDTNSRATTTTSQPSTATTATTPSNNARSLSNTTVSRPSGR